MKKLAIALCLGLSACSTAEVQQRCAEAEDLVRDSILAPAEVRVAVTIGARLCQDPRYAALRERVILWLRERK